MVQEVPTSPGRKGSGVIYSQKTPFWEKLSGLSGSNCVGFL